MNVYIKGQISNMIEMSKTFEYACELAALQDDIQLGACSGCTFSKSGRMHQPHRYRRRARRQEWKPYGRLKHNDKALGASFFLGKNSYA